MKKLALFVLATSLAAGVHAQTPAAPAAPAAPGTSSVAPAATPAKPLAMNDKKFLKDLSEAILIEQKYLALIVDNKTATFSEDTKKATGPMAGELKRAWTALATLAQSKNAELATEVSKNDLAKVAKVAKEKPDKFEKEFFKDFSKEAAKTTRLMESAKSVQDADVKRFAEDWTTLLKGHEKAAEAEEKKLSGKK